MTRWRPAYVGIGSNLGDRRAQVEAAFAACAALPETRLIARSAVYESQPFGPVAQPPFLNAAAGLLTRLLPDALLAGLQEAQRRLGRSPGGQRWGPREIDLDLLVLGDEQASQPGLQLPHPGIPERDFVLYPLCDIAPDLLVPGAGRVRDLASRVADRGLRRVG